MPSATKIHWCDSTCNPVMGCSGCELWNEHHRWCYAGKLHLRLGGTSSGYAVSFTQPTPFPGRVAAACGWSNLRGWHHPEKPWLDGLPRIIFLSDMGEALSEGVGFEFLENEIIDNVVGPLGRQYIWLWLTKQAARMAEFSDWLAAYGVAWPDNLWVGTTVSTMASTSRIDDLFKVGTENTLRFLSVEPQWESLNLNPWLDRLDWVFQAGQSGGDDMPFDLAWARELREQCQAHRVPYFLEQLGSHVVENGQRKKFAQGHGSDWDEWPADLRIREIPNYSQILARQASRA